MGDWLDLIHQCLLTSAAPPEAWEPWFNGLKSEMEYRRETMERYQDALELIASPELPRTNGDSDKEIAFAALLKP